MFNTKFIISTIVFITFLIITSTIKNKTRVIEKQITNLNNIIISKEKNINEAQLEFYYLTSPLEIEKRLSLIGFDIYEPIIYSKIFLSIPEFTNLKNNISNLKNLNEKEIKKK